MHRRVLASLGAATTMTLVAMASLPVSGQSSAAPPLVITAYNGGSAAAYTVPKTPWGDPDLQGVWSSDDATMPMSRPQNFGDRLYLNDEEFAAREKQIKTGISNAENAVGSFRGDFARRAFRQTSLIVDPPDGRTPAFTAEAQKRRAPRDQGTFGERPVRFNGRLHPLRPLHHPRHRRVGDAGHLRQRQPHRAGAGHGGDQLRDDSRHARLLHRRPSACWTGHPAVSR